MDIVWLRGLLLTVSKYQIEIYSTKKLTKNLFFPQCIHQHNHFLGVNRSDGPLGCCISARLCPQRVSGQVQRNLPHRRTTQHGKQETKEIAAVFRSSE